MFWYAHTPTSAHMEQHSNNPILEEVDGIPFRPVGLSKDGGMEIFGVDGLSQICELDGTNWLL